MQFVTPSLIVLFLVFSPAIAQAQGQQFVCPIEPAPGTPIHRSLLVLGGGMAGDGWDGVGPNPATILWHVEGTTADFTGSGQRQALIDAMQTWADIVQITFWEIPVANQNRSVDWDFQVDNHCAAESAECGDSDCPFDGPGGVIAHAGFPPGVNSTCVNPMEETWAGNVHFDDDELFEQDAGNSSAFSMTLIAAHEVGHGIGLTHDSGPGGPHIMRPGFLKLDAMQAPSSSDTLNIVAGYLAGAGLVQTLETTGVWVDGGYGGTEVGTPTNPFDTVDEGANGVPPFSVGIVVHVEAGSYPESVVITQGMFLEPENGTVVIGAP